VASNLLHLLTQLHDHHVEFVIVGGVAAALHGGTSVTFDLDIVPSLEPSSWAAAVDVLWALGARARIPEPSDGGVEVDLLVSESDQFDGLRARAVG
jgi:hypothetical protein